MAQRKYQITIARNGRYHKGKALLITNQGNGYLWLGDEEGSCIGWIDERQLDGISKAWLRVRQSHATTLARWRRRMRAVPRKRVAAHSQKEKIPKEKIPARMQG